MKAIDIFYAVGNVSDELIEKTGFLTPRAKPKMHRINRRLLIAACLLGALLLLGTVGVSTYTTIKEAWEKAHATETPTEVVTETPTDDAQSSCELFGHMFSTCNTCDICQYTIPVTEGLLYESDSENYLYGVSKVDSLNIREAYVPAFNADRKVTMIDNRAFANCQKLKNVVLPNTIKKICMGAFFGCNSLKSIDIPDSVEFLEYDVFMKCTGLTSVQLGNNITELPEGVFRECTALKSIEIPDNVTYIGKAAFWDCTSLESIILPLELTVLDDDAFRNCISLTQVTVTNHTRKIGNRAFFNCTSLTAITLPNNIEQIGDSVFEYCTSLRTINFIGTMEEWYLIEKGTNWNRNTGDYVVKCTDGEISK